MFLDEVFGLCVQATYTARQSGLAQWLDHSPDTAAVEQCRREIRALRKQLRHKQADLVDAEEEASGERETLEQEIDELLLRLHKEWNVHDRHLSELLEVMPYFPELPALHPQLGLSEFEDGCTFVKEGRQLEHYRLKSSLHGAEVPTYLSTFAGRSVALQEYMIATEGDVMRKRALAYANVSHPCLQPVDAIFFDSMGKKMFVQLPHHTGVSFDEWVAAVPSEPERYGVMIGLLAAIGSLHGGQVCHGCVQPQSVRVMVTERGTAHPVLSVS